MDDPNPTPPAPHDSSEQRITVTVERVMRALTRGDIVGNAQGKMRWSSNYTFLVAVCDEELELRAIYKPRQGERPLWDFPDGTLCQREYAAFLISEALGWRLVPPTVLRDGPRGVGSLQLYIDHDPEITYFNLGEAFNPQLQRMAAFDVITNNADRKGGHCLLGPGNKVWGIDHGICFHVAPKLRTVIWEYASQDIPSEMLTEMAALETQLQQNECDLMGQLRDLLGSQEIKALQGRLHKLLKNAKFPEPGYGPSYPWPPV